MVPTTQPEPIEAYSIRVAEAWKIGRKGQDNGALLVVAKNDRKMRIEVGYGLEGVLTDATSRRIIAETIAPLFRQGQFARGHQRRRRPDHRGRRQGRAAAAADSEAARNARGGGFDFETLLILLFVVVPVARRHPAPHLRQGRAARRSAPASSARARGSSPARCSIGVVGGDRSRFIVMLLFGHGGGGIGAAAAAAGRRRAAAVAAAAGAAAAGGGGGGFSGGGGSFGGGGASGGW